MALLASAYGVLMQAHLTIGNPKTNYIFKVLTHRLQFRQLESRRHMHRILVSQNQTV